MSDREAMGGSELIAAERKRQIDVERWTTGHDDAHEDGELAHAAAAYALSDERLWPWEADSSWNPGADALADLARVSAERDELRDAVQHARDNLQLHVDTEGGGWIISEPLQEALAVLNAGRTPFRTLPGKVWRPERMRHDPERS